MFSEPCLAVRYNGPPSRQGEGAPPSIPDVLSAEEVKVLLALVAPKPDEVPGATTAREVIEAVSGKQVVWLFDRSPRVDVADGTDDFRSIELVTYARLYAWSVGNDQYASGVAPSVRTVGDLLGGWLDMARQIRGSFARVAGNEPELEFDPALMITPVAIQFFPLAVEFEKMEQE